MHQGFEKQHVGAVADVEWDADQSEQDGCPGFGREIESFQVLFGVDEGEDKAQGACEQDVGQYFAGHLHGFDEGVAVQNGVAIGDAGFVVAYIGELQGFGCGFDHVAGNNGGEEGKNDAQDAVFKTEHGEGDGDDVRIEQRRGYDEGYDDFQRGFALHGFDQGHHAAGADGQDGAVNEGKNLIFRVEALDLEKVFFHQDAGKDAEDDHHKEFEEAFVELKEPLGNVFVNHAGVVAQGAETHEVHVDGVQHHQDDDRVNQEAGVALVFGGLLGVWLIGRGHF